MKGMILAAGYGTRFRPVTYTLPKPMVPLCNRPLIGWAVESFLDAGVREIIVNLHHLPEPLERHLRARYDGEATFQFSFEQEILGTGGGVRRVRPLLEGAGEFFLVNGDTVQFPRYEAMRAAREEHQALAALTLRHPPTGDRFTAVWHDRGLITGFGNGSGEALMFAGSHLISSRVFDYLPDKEFSGIVDEVYQPVLDDRREVIAGVIDDGLWFDVGSPQRYVSASFGLLEAIIRGEVTPPAASNVSGDSLLDESAAIEGTISRSIVGARSVIGGDLVDSVVWEDCAVSEGARLERCIVSHGVEIPAGLQLQDALICRDDSAIPDDAAYERRDGLVVVRV